MQVYLCKIGKFKKVEFEGKTKLQLNNLKGRKILCIKRGDMFFDIAKLKGYEVISGLDILDKEYVYDYKCVKVDEDINDAAVRANSRLDFYESIGMNFCEKPVSKASYEVLECQLAMFMGYENGMARAISSGNFLKALLYDGTLYDLKTGEEVPTFSYEDKIIGESYVYESNWCEITQDDLIPILEIIKKQGNQDELPKIIRLNFTKSQNN